MAKIAADAPNLVIRADTRGVLWRLFSKQVKFVIGDPTEINPPQA